KIAVALKIRARRTVFDSNSCIRCADSTHIGDSEQLLIAERVIGRRMLGGIRQTAAQQNRGASELYSNSRLQNTAIARGADRTESIRIHQFSGRIERQVRRRRIRQAGKIECAVHPAELGMVEHVERIYAELHMDSFCDSDASLQRHIKVPDT